MVFDYITVAVFPNGYPNAQMQSNDFQNFIDHIDNIIENMAEGLTIPQFIKMRLGNGLIEATCSNEFSLLFLTSVVNTWPEQNLNIVYAENIPKQYLTITIPEIGLDSATVLTQLARSNQGIDFNRWEILEMVEELNGTDLTFFADVVSFLNVQNKGLVLKFKDYSVAVNHFEVNDVE